MSVRTLRSRTVMVLLAALLSISAIACSAGGTPTDQGATPSAPASATASDSEGTPEEQSTELGVDDLAARRAYRTARNEQFSSGPRPCLDPSPPQSRVKVAFSNAPHVGPSKTAELAESAICAAAPGTRIRIAMFWITDESDAPRRVVDALQWVAANRDVRISLVMDSAIYELDDPSNVQTLETLEEFAEVALCEDGCRSDVGPEGAAGGGGTSKVQHNKYLVVDDTVWEPQVDTLVWISSANWAPAQLAKRYQDSVMVWDDPDLANQFAVRFDDLETCAKRGCEAWNEEVADRGLSPEYRVKNIDGVWYDGHPAPWQGTPGRGTSVLFSPVHGEDPLADELARYDCTQEHQTIWVAQRMVGPGRVKFVRELVALQNRGCDVRLTVSSRINSWFIRGADSFRAKGINVACVEGIHHKYLLIDAIERSTGKPTRVLYAGSQGIGIRALRFSDEAMLRLTTDAGSAQASKENNAAWMSFFDHHQAMLTDTTTCPTL